MLQTPLDVETIRDDFPILAREVDGRSLAYLDNAATAQKPEQVIEAVQNFYEQYNANVGRGLHMLTQEASMTYKHAHRKVAEFIGADSIEEVVFTSNTTDGLNTVAFSWSIDNLSEGDDIVLTEMEHHSSLVPWQQVAERTGAELRFLEIDEHGRLKEGELEEKITRDTAVVAVTHVSNVFGTVTPVQKLCKRADEVGAISVIDGAQSVPHMPVNVKEIGCDFLAFSGHKMCGPTGTGVLYGKKELLEDMQPFRFGGGMVGQVSKKDASWSGMPWRFEAGTPNIAGGIGLGSAVDYLEKIGMGSIRSHGKTLARYAVEQLEAIEDITVYSPPASYDKRCGVVSFNIDGVHPHDTSQILDNNGVAVRAGHHCAQPVMEKLGVPGTCRASFYLYNTHGEVDRLVAAVEEAVEVFKG